MVSSKLSRLVDRTKRALSRGEPRTPSQTVEQPQGLEVLSEGHESIVEYVLSMFLLLPDSQG
jgi:hypothetical protein